jgi:hypothetical protein
MQTPPASIRFGIIERSSFMANLLSRWKGCNKAPNGMLGEFMEIFWRCRGDMVIS